MPGTKSGLSFVWKIENYSMLPHQFGESLHSPKFEIDAWGKFNFRLHLFPRGSIFEGKLALFLWKEPADIDLKLNFTLAVESTEPSERKLKTIIDHVLKSNWGFEDFMSLDDIYAETKHYLPQDTLKVRCEISPLEETSAELKAVPESKPDSLVFWKHCVFHTSIQVQRRSFTWSIRHVKQRIEDASIFLTSALKNSPSLKLTLNFNKMTSGGDIPIVIEQTKLSSEEEQLFVKCKITVMSFREEDQTFKISFHLFKLSTSDVWNFPSFIKTSMLTDKRYLKVDNTMFLRCEFAFSYKASLHHLENNYLPCTFEPSPKNSELSIYFEDIYDNEKFCDVELKAGGRIFPYYKLLLCARSSVFSAMFENNMKEKNLNIVEIEDVDPDTLQKMLTYLHSDVLQEDLLAEDALSLYRS